jgi:hypothetical protein
MAKQGSISFLKKRNKKLLFFGFGADTAALTPTCKSFLVLFFKKELLSFGCLPPAVNGCRRAPR